jgi:hypothetical protein
VWLEKLKFSRIHSDGKNPIGGAEAHHDSKPSLSQTLFEKRKRAEKETDPEGHTTSVGLQPYPLSIEHRPDFHGILPSQDLRSMNYHGFYGAHIDQGNIRIDQGPPTADFYGSVPRNSPMPR